MVFWGGYKGSKMALTMDLAANSFMSYVGKNNICATWAVIMQVPGFSNSIEIPTLPTSWHAPAAAAKVISSERMPDQRKEGNKSQTPGRFQTVSKVTGFKETKGQMRTEMSTHPLPGPCQAQPLNSSNIFTASSHRWLHAIRAALWPELVVAIRACIAWARVHPFAPFKILKTSRKR